MLNSIHPLCCLKHHSDRYLLNPLAVTPTGAGSGTVCILCSGVLAFTH